MLTGFCPGKGSDAEAAYDRGLDDGRGLDDERIRTALRAGRITRIIRGVYGAGPTPPTPLDIQRATALVTGGVCDAVLTAQLGGWDGVKRFGPHVLVAERSSGKRGWTRRVKQLPTDTVTVAQVQCLAPALALRDPSIPAPTRQFAIYDANGNFVGRPDLWWPELGIFVELDGQGHKNQPVCDASRQTRIVIATAWRPGRFTWTQVHDFPEATLRDIAALVAPITVS